VPLDMELEQVERDEWEAHCSIGHVVSNCGIKEQFCHIHLIPQSLCVIQQWWANLYDKEEHFCLQHAIAHEIDDNKQSCSAS
jgi:hypothetical protein